jgi:activator of HSP90 ATPase
MVNIRNSEAVRSAPTRRWVVAAAGIAVGRMVTGAALGAAFARQDMKEGQTDKADKARTSLHQEIDFKVVPAKVYEALLDSKQFGTATGLPAEIDPKAGGAFKTFGGLIEGRNVELVSGVRIVQAWRPGHWDPGVYSIVRFELKPKDIGSVLVLDHAGFPEGDYGSLYEGWKARYWNPLAKYFAV